MSKEVVIIGAGGHAKVIADIIIKSGDEVVGFLDDNIEKNTNIIGNYKVIGKIEECLKLQENNELYFIIAIGNNLTRKEIAEKYNLNYYTAIHPTAIIGIQVEIGTGTVIMANTCINPNSKVGEHCIINTGAIVEHDNIIENYVHISPNATLCGTVKVEKYTHIGAGSVIKNNITIADNCIIGAGAVVVKNINKYGTYVGVPAKSIKG
ncbi:MAG: acetyltransferase [Clostridia bacterium]|nr:acetyltransferase [Clostridia bacterium]